MGPLDELSAAPIIDADLLFAFSVFAEELNFTRAARRVGLSQPALFERVRRLTEEVGAPLYRKEGRRLLLTGQGVEVAAFARQELQRGRRFLDRLRGTSSSRLTLAAGEGSFLYLLGPALTDFPGELELLTLGGPDAAQAVLTGRADLAVGSWDVCPDALVQRPLLSTPLCAAVRGSHPLAAQATVSLRDLGRHRLILAPDGQRHRALVGRAVASVGEGPSSVLTADGWPLMLSFAAMGLGVAVVNGTCHVPPGVVLRPIPELGRIAYSALMRRDAPQSPARSELLQRLEALDPDA